MTDVNAPNHLDISSAESADKSIRVPQLKGVVYASQELPEPKGEARIAPDDRVRRTIAIGLIVLLGIIVAAGFVLLMLSKAIELDPDDLKGLVQLFFTSILTLVSTVLGFYFGAEKRPKDG